MNQTFDFQRFLLMLRLEIAQKGRNQVMMALLMVSLTVVMLLPIMSSREYVGIFEGLHATAFVLLVIFGSSLYTNQVFSNYANPSSGMAAIMVPASHFEKWLAALLMNLLFVVPFLVFFSSMHHWTVSYANANLLPGEQEYQFIPLAKIAYFSGIPLLVQSVCFLGSIYFTRASFIKTAAAILVASFVAIFGYQILANFFSEPGYEIETNLYGNWHVLNRSMGNYFKVNFSENYQQIKLMIPYLLVLAFWYTSFVRLREKEI